MWQVHTIITIYEDRWIYILWAMDYYIQMFIWSTFCPLLLSFFYFFSLCFLLLLLFSSLLLFAIVSPLPFFSICCYFFFLQVLVLCWSSMREGSSCVHLIEQGRKCPRKMASVLVGWLADTQLSSLNEHIYIYINSAFFINRCCDVSHSACCPCVVCEETLHLDDLRLILMVVHELLFHAHIYIIVPQFQLVQQYKF